MLLRRLQEVPGGVELLPGRSLEVRESSELQIGGLRALEEAWTITSMLRHFLSSLVVFGVSEGVGLEAEGWGVQGGQV